MVISLRRWKEDMQCLKTMWFGKISGDSHKERLEAFYESQADAYDSFRAEFLHGRRRMLASCAARLRGSTDMVWVDLGGGTAENVKTMSEYMSLSAFKKIYVVDLCSSLCRVATKKVEKQGWMNVEVINEDAVTFVPKDRATLITFSYSLSMIPPFMAVIDKAISYLDKDGIVGVTDFYTSAKYDTDNRQHSWINRCFWRSVFDLDGIELGPERRDYLEHKIESVFEYNSSGRIPYVPLLKVPYYVWIGRRPDCEADSHRFPVRASDEFEAKRPSTFPPTFLYSLSWEDPREDDKYLNIQPNDRVLTLTSGGCNALDLVLQGADLVVSVDMNPAQSYLLELKRVASIRLSYEDMWLLFGEGVHPNFLKLLERDLAPFLSQGAIKFWQKKARYFKSGLYYHGGMGRIVTALYYLAKLFRLGQWVQSLVNAPTVEKQKELWFETMGQFFVKDNIWAQLFSVLFMNRLVLWYCAGVCKGQLRHINKEGDIYNYVINFMLSTVSYSPLDRNYFFRCILTGRFAPNCCPRFLEKDNYDKLKGTLANKECLLIRTTTFVDELKKRVYSKVILMDHVDWLDQEDIDILCQALKDHVEPGGIVIWRSASRNPSYSKCIQDAGFKVVRISTNEKYMDRVNMYASFYMAVRNGGPVNPWHAHQPSTVELSKEASRKWEKSFQDPVSPDSVLPTPPALSPLGSH
ncbi:hypothetical protein O6H91_21G073200 [Diphasiastrum complanatum]|uniref:Uncharacterized protein n=1 Tax=Diphasiastrum complanatum TaxID=34168 RepID=A0ACC2ALV2_DIPCM|nr:hypothetical protein O6H91_21G073200 [Diphasiastrum complanatum]